MVKVMKNNGVEVEAQKIYKRKLFVKIVKIAFLLLLILISIIYLFLYIIYAGGRFTVSLDKNMSNRKNVFLSEDGNVKNKARKLSADTIEYMDNISIKWLPDNIDTEKNGGHNGDNYIAYTFYVINSGKEKVNYWYEIDIDDTIKNVDEAANTIPVETNCTIEYFLSNLGKAKPVKAIVSIMSVVWTPNCPVLTPRLWETGK